jgi:hypothetical protein
MMAERHTRATQPAMLQSINQEEADRLRSFLLEAGYTEDNLRARGVTELPSAKLRNLPMLADLTREPGCLNTLLRWFWLGESQEVPVAEEVVPPWLISLALGCGLLRQHAGSLAPRALLVHFDGFFIVSDHPRAVDQEDAGLVLWPNPTSRLLGRFAVRRPAEATLDLGTGNGILALGAASYSKRVVATDLNCRATECAMFNSRLNGFSNIECLTGDGFIPVKGQKFDSILSNPPFFITPSNNYMFCENPMDLDFLCRQLTREAPAHLSEGGYFQMLCEWAQVRGQSWQERIGEWLQGTGCDALVLKGQTHALSEYAHARIGETVTTPDGDDELYDRYMAYYRQRGVEAIHNGMVAMRRREGQNWLVIEEVTETPAFPFGEAVQLRFMARDFLQTHSTDDRMSEVKPKLSPQVRLESFFHQANGKWQPDGLMLRLTKGFPFVVEVQPLLADFLGRCDGSRTLGELCTDLAAKLQKPVETVQPESFRIVRTLIERGLLVV